LFCFLITTWSEENTHVKYLKDINLEGITGISEDRLRVHNDLGRLGREYQRRKKKKVMKFSRQVKIQK